MNPDPARTGVSVVVTCLNEAAHIERLLSGLANQEQPLREIILVDGGSTDGTLQAVERWKGGHPEIPLSVLPVSGHPIPRALNTGIRSASAAVIVRLDAHCRPLPGYVAASVSALKIPGTGVVGGPWLIAPGGRGRLARAIALAVSHPFGAGDAKYRSNPDLEAPVDVDTVPFGCFTKQLWADLGGYDERLHANEDYEFNYRVRLSGLRVILHPEIHSEYFARTDLGRLASQYFRYGWWKAEMLRLHPRSLRWRQAVPTLFSAALLASGLLAALVPSWSWPFVTLVALYLTAAVLASAHICAMRRTWGLIVVLPVVFGTLHVSWGMGVIANLLSVGFGHHVSGAAAQAWATGAEPPEAPPRPTNGRPDTSSRR